MHGSTVGFRFDCAVHADQFSSGIRPGAGQAEAVVEGRRLFWGAIRTQGLRAGGQEGRLTPPTPPIPKRLFYPFSADKNYRVLLETNQWKRDDAVAAPS